MTKLGQLKTVFVFIDDDLYLHPKSKYIRMKQVKIHLHQNSANN